MESIDRKRVWPLILSILVAASATFLLLSFLSASPTVAIGPAQAGPASCLTTDTLEYLVNCIHRYMPDAGEGFTEPTKTDMDQWREIVKQMMDEKCDANINWNGYGWSNAFTVTTFIDDLNNNAYCVFMETETNHAGARVTHGWGTFIYNPTYCRELNISAPHAKSETDTAVEAVGIFKNTQSRTFLMAGTHRRASPTLSLCQPDECEDGCMKSDAAHNITHTFHATVAELKEYYDSQNCEFYHLQFHGMKSCCNDYDVYLSHGVITPPKPGDKILVLSDTLSAYHPDWRIGVPGDGTCNLNGTKNVQGRLLNRVPGNKVCDIPASSYSGYFIHIEQCREYRDPDDWFPAINDTWMPHLTVTKQASPNPMPAGAQLTYTIHVSNTGEARATGVVITDALPANAHFYTATHGGSLNDGVVTWDNLTVSPCGGTAQVTFVVTTCQSISNDSYRVTTSTQGITSSWGTPVTTIITTPTIAVSFSPASICVCPNQPITFTDTSTTDGGPIVAWGWDFGDEGTASSSTVSHRYTTTGMYTVTLTVTDTCGFTGTKTIANAVRVDCCVYLPILVKNYTH